MLTVRRPTASRARSHGRSSVATTSVGLSRRRSGHPAPVHRPQSDARQRRRPDLIVPFEANLADAADDFEPLVSAPIATINRELTRASTASGPRIPGQVWNSGPSQGAGSNLENLVHPQRYRCLSHGECVRVERCQEGARASRHPVPPCDATVPQGAVELHQLDRGRNQEGAIVTLHTHNEGVYRPSQASVDPATEVPSRKEIPGECEAKERCSRERSGRPARESEWPVLLCRYLEA